MISMSRLAGSTSRVMPIWMTSCSSRRVWTESTMSLHPNRSSGGSVTMSRPLQDPSIGIGLAARTQGKKFLFDVVADVQETALLSLKSKETGVIYIGGGTPKNFIQQMEVTASFWDPTVSGHEYAL